MLVLRGEAKINGFRVADECLCARRMDGAAQRPEALLFYYVRAVRSGWSTGDTIFTCLRDLTGLHLVLAITYLAHGLAVNLRVRCPAACRPGRRCNVFLAPRHAAGASGLDRDPHRLIHQVALDQQVIGGGADIKALGSRRGFGHGVLRAQRMPPPVPQRPRRRRHHKIRRAFKRQGLAEGNTCCASCSRTCLCPPGQMVTSSISNSPFSESGKQDRVKKPTALSHPR